MRIEEIRELAKKLGFDGDMNELRMGVDEEWKEHSKTAKHYTDDTFFFAASIAVDHLNEDPHYYTKLKNLMKVPSQESDKERWMRIRREHGYADNPKLYEQGDVEP